MQASAYIPSTVFDEFELKEDVTFSLSLNILVECLCMFWPTSQEDSVAVQIFYKVNSESFSSNMNLESKAKNIDFILQIILN